jgi:predicted HicB family RNase H-like nuclease
MSDVMTYKGYIGSVRYSEEDEVFHGKIEAINDLIMFEGTSVKELKKAFHEAVDDYLEIWQGAAKTLQGQLQRKDTL